MSSENQPWQIEIQSTITLYSSSVHVIICLRGHDSICIHFQKNFSPSNRITKTVLTVSQSLAIRTCTFCKLPLGNGGSGLNCAVHSQRQLCNWRGEGQCGVAQKDGGGVWNRWLFQSGDLLWQIKKKPGRQLIQRLLRNATELENQKHSKDFGISVATFKITSIYFSLCDFFSISRTVQQLFLKLKILLS